jgi:NADH:ubiquinone oxidoreductase subunit D
MLPGPLRLSLGLDGEVVRSAAATSGYARRGVVSVLKRSTWRQGIAIMDRLDPEAAIFGEWVFCLAAEKALRAEAPARGQAIRVLLAELSRISAHLHQLATVARAAGSEPVFHFMLREREVVLDQVELASGSRHAPAFLRVGGVREDVTEGFLERLQDVCQRLLERISEYNDLLTYNEAFIRRVSGRAVISRDLVGRHGITGVPARIFDRTEDLRWKGLAGYSLVQHQDLPANLSSGIPGDLHQRFVLKLQEIIQSAHLVQELAQHLPSGPYRSDGDFDRVPAGTHSAEVEAPRGRLKIEIQSGGGASPSDVRFETPSEPLLAALPEFLVGAPVEDLKLVLASLDLQVGEVDQ